MKGEGVAEEHERTDEQGQREPSEEQPTQVVDDGRPPTEAEEYQWHTGERRDHGVG